MSSTPTRTLAAIALATLVLLSGCSAGPADAPEASQGASDSSAPAADLLAEVGFAGHDIREVVEELERTPLAQRRDDLIASVRPEAVLFIGDDGTETAVPLDAEFYLSIAPYSTVTHDCYFHSLTTCVGELGGASVHIRVVTDSGDVLVDEDRTVNDNGFVGMWLPRDIEATLTVTHDSGAVTSRIATGSDDPTCLTDLQLT